MPIKLRLHFARILCLLMAIYLLNFSIDCPAGNSTIAFGIESFAHQPGQIENLLGMALDVSIVIEKDFPGTAEKESEAETEVVDTVKFFPTSSLLSMSSAPLYLHEHLLPDPASDLKTLYPEVNDLPPRNTHFFAVA